MDVVAPWTSPAQFAEALQTSGWAVLKADDVATVTKTPIAGLGELVPSWADLPRDTWLRDGGRYRSRRHASFVLNGDGVVRQAHRAHYQPESYNALHGGLERWFEPFSDAVATAAPFLALIAGFGRAASALKGARTWFVEAHQFRIDTADGIGRPTPEGAHRDGVDLVVVMVVGRHGIKGGETRVFQADGPLGVRFTLDQPFSALVLDDDRVIHESTPIQSASDAAGIRDSLVITYRRNGFPSPTTER